MTNCSRCNSPLPAGSSFCPSCGAPAEVDGDDLLASSASDPTGLLDRLRENTAGEFTIIRELGRGGMGRVYLAHEIALDRRVALKVLPPNLAEHASVVRRFQREARTAGKLSHPHIVPVHQVSERGGLHFFTMPYVAGPNLRQILRKTPRLEPERCRRYLREAADALAYAHGKDVIHRDIKPENMLFEGSRDGRLLLTDFGIAKALGSATTLTRPGDMMGTPYFMSPEQLEERGGIDGRADQYSLGLVGYEMLAGRFPFAADSLAGIVYKHLHDYPEPLERLRPDVPADLRTVIERAIRKNADDRYPKMGDMLEALSFPQPRPVVSGGRRATARPRSRFRRVYLGAAGILLLAVAGVLLTRPLWRSSSNAAEVGLAELVVPPDEDLTEAASPPPDSVVARDSAGAVPEAGTEEVRRSGAAPERLQDPSPTVQPDPLAKLREEAAEARTLAETARAGAIQARADSILPERFAAIDAQFAAASDELQNDELVRAVMVLGTVKQAFEDLERDARAQAAEPEPRAETVAGGEAVADSTVVGQAEGAGHAAPAESVEEAIESLLAAYGEALAAEDLARLERDIYKAKIPAADSKTFEEWFGRADDLKVNVQLLEFESGADGDSAEARLRQEMSYRLARTGDARRTTIELAMRFVRDSSGWRLLRLELP